MIRTALQWIDANGDERLSYLLSAAGAPATTAALLAASAAGLSGTFAGVLTPWVSAPPVNAVYPSVGNMTALDIKDAVVGTSRVYIPALQLGVFQSDGQTLDTGNLLVTGLAAQMVLDGVTIPSSTLPMLLLTGGVLLRRGTTVRDTYQAGTLISFLRRGVVWGDCQGHTTLTLIDSIGGGGAVLFIMDGMSNATPLQWWEGTLNVITPVTATGYYQSVTDEARITCWDDYGNVTRLTLPAPLASIFYADQHTIDMSSGLMVALAAAILSELVSPASGLPITHVVNGFLSQSKQIGIR